jgi:hypothetical protein
MPEANHQPGEAFIVQFVWQIPDGDFIRALFVAEVLARDERLDRYRLRLREWKAGRQETPAGAPRPAEEAAKDYWAMVQRLTGRQIYLAYEVEDGWPIRLRLDTLTGEHTFFSRLDDAAAP